jgi:hypothetical protein
MYSLHLGSKSKLSKQPAKLGWQTEPTKSTAI